MHLNAQTVALSSVCESWNCLMIIVIWNIFILYAFNFIPVLLSVFIICIFWKSSTDSPFIAWVHFYFLLTFILCLSVAGRPTSCVCPGLRMVSTWCRLTPWTTLVPLPRSWRETAGRPTWTLWATAKLSPWWYATFRHTLTLKTWTWAICPCLHMYVIAVFFCRNSTQKSLRRSRRTAALQSPAAHTAAALSAAKTDRSPSGLVQTCFGDFVAWWFED